MVIVIIVPILVKKILISMNEMLICFFFRGVRHRVLILFNSMSKEKLIWINFIGIFFSDYNSDFNYSYSRCLYDNKI